MECEKGFEKVGEGCQSYDSCDPTNKDSGECVSQVVNTPKTLPRVGAEFDILLPLIASAITLAILYMIKYLYAKISSYNQN